MKDGHHLRLFHPIRSASERADIGQDMILLECLGRWMVWMSVIQYRWVDIYSRVNNAKYRLK